jgi:AcrR family transcriptional regulator
LPTARRRRAQSPEAKAARAQDLLLAAERLCAGHSFAALNLADVAREAGLAKASLYFYYPNKESLGLALIEGLLTRWFEGVNRALEAAGPSAPETVARLLAKSTEREELLVELLSILGTQLEPAIELSEVLRFKQFLAAQMNETGARLEKVAPFLGPGGGSMLLLHLHISLIGVRQISAVSPAVDALLRQPELSHMRIDPATALEHELWVHLEGLSHLARRWVP